MDKISVEEQETIKAHTLKLLLLNDPQIRAQHEAALAKWDEMFKPLIDANLRLKEPKQ